MKKIVSFCLIAILLSIFVTITAYAADVTYTIASKEKSENASIIEFTIGLSGATINNKIINGSVSLKFNPDVYIFVGCIPKLSKEWKMIASNEKGQVNISYSAENQPVVIKSTSDIAVVTLAVKKNAIVGVNAVELVSTTANNTEKSLAADSKNINVEIGANNLKSATPSKPSIAKGSADLSELTVESGVLAPNFDPAITEYGVELPSSVDTANVLYKSANSKATTTVNGVNDLLDGKGSVINVKVLSEDKNTEKAYTLNVLREAKQVIATVSDTTVSQVTSKPEVKETDIISENMEIVPTSAKVIIIILILATIISVGFFVYKKFINPNSTEHILDD